MLCYLLGWPFAAGGRGRSSQHQRSRRCRRVWIDCRAKQDEDMFLKESNLSAEDRVDLYTIGAEPDLDGTVEAVRGHSRSFSRFLSKRPLAPYNVDVCDELDRWLDGFSEKEFQLDAGCGTGTSTLLIAEDCPSQPVVGVDRSAVRIFKTKESIPPNVHFVRADLVDFWRIAILRGWRVSKQYLLYPNPYPKKKDIKKRWHGHPSFPLLLKVADEIELRASWKGYVEEFACAVRTIFEDPQILSDLGLENRTLVLSEVSTLSNVERCISNFERKYVYSGIPIYHLNIQIK